MVRGSAGISFSGYREVNWKSVFTELDMSVNNLKHYVGINIQNQLMFNTYIPISFRPLTSVMKWAWNQPKAYRIDICIQCSLLIISFYLLIIRSSHTCYV